MSETAALLRRVPLAGIDDVASEFPGRATTRDWGALYMAFFGLIPYLD